jgi:hypothetical protein
MMRAVFCIRSGLCLIVTAGAWPASPGSAEFKTCAERAGHRK